MTYRDECHFDGCQTRFIGIVREDYVEHIRESHGRLKASIWDKLVVDESETPALSTTENDHEEATKP